MGQVPPCTVPPYSVCPRLLRPVIPRTHRLVALLVTSASPSCDEDAEYLLCTPPAVECAGVRGGGGESVSQNSTMHIDAPHAKIAVT